MTVAITQVGYDQLRRRTTYLGCGAGQHVTFTTTDRDGVWFWACRTCPAYRVQGDPTWRTP